MLLSQRLIERLPIENRHQTLLSPRRHPEIARSTSTPTSRFAGQHMQSKICQGRFEPLPQPLDRVGLAIEPETDWG